MALLENYMKLKGNSRPRGERQNRQQAKHAYPAGRGTGKKSEEENPGKTVREAEKEKTVEEYLAELNDLTGLYAVKQEVNTLVNLIRVRTMRKRWD